MNNPGGRSILAEIGRQLVNILDEMTKEFTTPPYAEPEDRSPRDRPRRLPEVFIPEETGRPRQLPEVFGPEEAERPRRQPEVLPPEAAPVEPTRPDPVVAGEIGAQRVRRDGRVKARRRSGTQLSIREQLHSPAEVRRALVLNEILGPPRSMSDPFR